MKPLCCAILLLTLVGCAVGPNYRRPAVDAPPVFRGGDAQTNSLGDFGWPQVFQDPALQHLIRTALTNNYDARIAFSRVEQAREIWNENRSLFLPSVIYQANADLGKNTVNGSMINNGGKSQTYYAGSINASWEIDLFGRIRRLNEAARAQFFASSEARRDVMISLIAEVAQAYYQLLALDEEIRIAQDSTNSFGQSMKIFNERYTGGVASKLEVSSAQALMASAATSVLELQRQMIAQEDAICYLLGVNPGPVARGSLSLAQEAPTDVPPGLPSSLLERRPDIREAEEDFHSANALVGVAKAEFFPRLVLTGLLGQVSSEASTFMNGVNSAWNVGAGLAGPLWEAGALKAQHRAALAAREQARLQYLSTILNAFRETSDALAARQQLAFERAQQIFAVEAYQESVKVANERYTLGRASYYEVLQEEQLLFPAENTLAQIQFNQMLAGVQLYRALGGGWPEPLPPSTAKSKQ